ncbi:MAG: DUF2304 domain-containing protein [Ignavibacteriae bacterium]|nr:DUF2304 domain-containing protein [Ignavibacteriota bacterium]
MSFKLQLFSLIVGLIFFLFILYIIRKRKLSPSYSVLWLLLALYLISIPLFQGVYVYFSRTVFGFYAENIIYITVIGFLLIYVLFLSSKVVRLNDQTKELISFTAILEKRIRDLER